ncbi:hypothetical protein SAMN02927923_03131 [Microvirga guangxiensis]|uniref:Uncharacterized protein n=1 Tax=Microvirga guangxiensis TaxID=549386 RepID=A0A1G5K986_9HYPH|nr:hypothetical protein SAMN02927923_03131 [Microvirga guangxiensis]
MALSLIAPEPGIVGPADMGVDQSGRAAVGDVERAVPQRECEIEERIGRRCPARKRQSGQNGPEAQ